MIDIRQNTMGFKCTVNYRSIVNRSPSLDLQGEVVNDEPIRERASIIIVKILWVIKYTINYGPIREWVSASYILNVLKLNGNEVRARQYSRVLQTQQRSHDIIAVIKDDCIVGHVPRSISRVPRPRLETISFHFISF